MLCSILSAIAAILLALVALGFYAAISSGDYPSRWFAEDQEQDRPTTVRRKRARLGGAEKGGREPVGSALLQVQQDLKGRRDRAKKIKH